jgi:hypothetical protein
MEMIIISAKFLIIIMAYADIFNTHSQFIKQHVYSFLIYDVKW